MANGRTTKNSPEKPEGLESQSSNIDKVRPFLNLVTEKFREMEDQIEGYAGSMIDLLNEIDIKKQNDEDYSDEASIANEELYKIEDSLKGEVEDPKGVVIVKNILHSLRKKVKMSKTEILGE